MYWQDKMANRRIHIETNGMHKMERDFEKASIPGKAPSTRKLGNLLTAAYAATQSKVHIDTGYLKASGRKSEHHVGDVWMGEIEFARHPGIFELARGDKPTGTDTIITRPGKKATKRQIARTLQTSHPTGGHHFFNGVEPFIEQMDEVVHDMFYDWFGRAGI